MGSRNAWCLLALLALQPRPRTRESIATDLWPDGSESSGAALRQALWLVRSAFIQAGAEPDTVFVVDDDMIGLRPELPIYLDVAHFEALARSAPVRCEEAADLYDGDLAQELTRECFARDRQRLADLFEDVLANVATTRLLRGELALAQRAALRLVDLDPLREEAHAVLIEVYGRRGSRSQVSRQYRRLRGLLRAELGVDPLPETERVYRAALDLAWAESERRARTPLPVVRRSFAVARAGLVGSLGLEPEPGALTRS